MFKRLLSHTLLLASALISMSGMSHARDLGDTVLETVQSIEARTGGRIGLVLHEIGSTRSWHYRADEPFALSSTFKPFACAALLSMSDKGEEELDRKVSILQEDLVTYSPVTTGRTGAPGMTLSELCEAAITISDNTAGNLILKAIGGPEGFTTYMQSIGDAHSRLDRWETDLNEARPGDPRDTTTPRAATESLATLIFSETLSPSSRLALTNWMRNDKVADTLLRSVVPADWQIADKTGAGGFGSRGIIAVMWPPERAPLVVAIYMSETNLSLAERNGVIAEIGASIVKTLAP